MRSNLAPVTASQDLQQSPAQRAHHRRLQVRVRLSPVNLVDDEQVSWVDVDALRAFEYGQFATPDVGAEAVRRKPGYLNNALQRPAPRVGNPALQMAYPRVNGCLRPGKIGGDRDGRQHTHRLANVPVFGRRPGCLAAIGELNAGGLPGGAKTREVAQNGVTRREEAAPSLAPPVAI